MVTQIQCPQCSGENPQGTASCRQCNAPLLPGGDVIANVTPRYRIRLGDTCTVCRAASCITFTSAHPPQLPIAGCREPGGCRCTLPAFTTAPPPAAADFAVASIASEDLGLRAGAKGNTLFDTATGAFSMEAVAAFGPAIVGETMRRGHALSLLLVSLDPHPALPQPDGATLDAQLRSSVSILRQLLRSGDVVARYGPGSLLLIAQGATEAGAIQIAQRLRAAVSTKRTVRDQEITVTVSQGLATLPQAGTDLGELTAEAEECLTTAIAQGGDRIVVSGRNVALSAPSVDLDAFAPPGAATRLAQATVRADSSRRALDTPPDTIVLQPQPGACPVCLDAARTVYPVGLAPSLPVAGCLSPGGCRCAYTAAPPDPRRRPPPIPAEMQPNLDIPRRLNDAALFGSDPKRRCSGEDLAAYLDEYPLLPFKVDLDLEAGEAAYLIRSARHSWDSVSATDPAQHGYRFPLNEPFSSWIKRTGPPPRLSGQPTAGWNPGLLCLTNWRIIFGRRGSVDSVLLADVEALESVRGGLACLVGTRGRRLVFLVPSSLQVGLCLMRALRDLGSSPT